MWYWGWDYFNCNPETGRNIMGQPCMNNYPNPLPFQSGPFGGYLIGGRWFGPDGYPAVEGFVDYSERAQRIRISEETLGKPVWLTGPIFATSDGRSFVSPSVMIECTPTYTANLPIWRAQTIPCLETITAVLSKSTLRVGDTVIAEVTVTGGGGGPFWVEGEGFGMPACQGEIDDQGKGSCFFKIGGKALAGERILGIYVSSSQNLGAASTHLVLKVLDDSDSPQPPNRPSPPANFEVVGKE